MIRIERGEYILREWRPADAGSLVEQVDNINIWNNTRDGLPHPYTRAAADTFIALATGKPVPEEFAIEIDRKAVGCVGYVPGSDVERISAEVGYWLGESYWGRGIMSDALDTLAGHIFTHTAILRLFASVFEFNEPSMRVLEKAGFRKVGILRNAAVKNGRITDMHYYERTK